ncbi:PREDICTED: uncharacterized serine-rich protein C215.13-like [Amphimedon queenslandica]|uniref:Ig-like domain-containing protein n=1 Tax=Amphimedon queenslandica TaxID=400682 RepID=A0AAN0JJ52_AMPQE|nr:PREDICTED: uncharacterized serine-rich protein C215.13-like [Amphimedon queenslandica]|eukprot:XP_019856816.1 PREDICTED: uncharacterized serine-rich protein C215.13-like [Amphimedon queenslandica]
MYHIMLLALVFGLCLLCSEGAELLESPESKTVQFNERPTFVCVGNGSNLVWIIDGKGLYSNNQFKGVTFTDAGGGSTVSRLLSSNLTINVTELEISYDMISQGIGISCQIVSQSPFDEAFSKTATLSVTGISPPQNISLSIDWILTWSSQFYRPRNALLNNQTFDVTVNGKVIVANTTSTSIQLRPFCTRPTEVNITAYIGSYHSSTSVLFENVIGERTIKIINYTTLVNGAECSITLNILVDTQHCDTLVSGQLLTSEGDVKNYPPQSINPSNGIVSTSYNMTGLQNCLSYDARINVSNTSNFTEDTANIAIEPLYSDVKDIEINKNEDRSINAQCIYSDMSTAMGCHVMFTHTTTGISQSFNIIGSDDKTINLSSSGVYAIAIYSINADGSIARCTCVQPKQVNVTLVTSATSSNGGSSTVSSVSSSTGSPIPSPSVTVETESESTSEVVSPPTHSTTSTFSSNKPTGTTKDTGAYIIGGGTTAAIITLIIAIFVVLAVLYLYYKQKRKSEEDPSVDTGIELDSIRLEQITRKTNVSLEDKVDQKDPAIRSEDDSNGTTRDPIVSPDAPRPVSKKVPVFHSHYDKKPVEGDFTAAPSSPSCNDGPLTVVPNHDTNCPKILNDETGVRSTFIINNVDSNEQLKNLKESPN